MINKGQTGNRRFREEIMLRSIEPRRNRCSAFRREAKVQKKDQHIPKYPMEKNARAHTHTYLMCVGVCLCEVKESIIVYTRAKLINHEFWHERTRGQNTFD